MDRSEAALREAIEVERSEQEATEAFELACDEMAECIYKDTCVRLLTARMLHGLPVGDRLADQLPIEDLAKACHTASESFFAQKLQAYMEEPEPKPSEFARAIMRRKE